MLIKTYRLRLYVLYLIPVLLMGGLVTRLYYVQVLNRGFYEKYAERQHFKKYPILPMRGNIYDSEGHELAGSVMLDQAFFNLRSLDPLYSKSGNEEMIRELLPKVAYGIAQVLQDPAMHYDEVLRRLKGEVNRHPSIGRGITEEKKLALKAELARFREKGLPQDLIDFEPEPQRRYSRGSLAPHVVGYTGWNSKTQQVMGQEGVERFYEDELRGREEEYIARRTATGKAMEPANPELLESTFGRSVKLTINESIQAVTQNVLQQGVEKTNADAGVAICYSVKTGEVLSMASYPSFDLNNLRASADSRTNRAIIHAIEPGSVMKIITFTSLFDDKKIEPFDVINCEGGTWIMPNKRRIVDSHRMGSATVAEAFQYSSNIGTIKAARAFDHATFYDHLKRFGFGERTGIDLPGESPGRLSHHREWTGFSMSSLPMGYELQLTAVQVVAAVGAIANKGNYMQPHVVKEILDHHGNTVERFEPKFLRSVASPAACRKVINLMELVVEKGTAKAAKLDGYRVGGKTGTTKKLVNGHYDKAYIASFCGIAPIEDPEVCIYVYVDNPKGSKVYGGSVAGPIFREIAREAMRVLRVPQNRPTMPAEEFSKTLEMVRNQIDGRVPIEMVNEVAEVEEGEVSPGVVPNLKNLTLREAVQRAHAAGLTVRPKGSGTVVSQDPGANETIEGEGIVDLVLANADDVLTRQLREVEEYVLDEKVRQERTSMTLASVGPATSVPLALKLGDARVNLPVLSEGVTLSPAATGLEKPRQAIAAGNDGARLPDMDEYANGQLDSAQGKRFDDFMKKVAEVEKQKAAQKPAPRDGSEDEAEAEQSTTRTSGPVPEIDGTDDYDPAAEEPVPVKIETPQRNRSVNQASGGSNDRGISLYNL